MLYSLKAHRHYFFVFICLETWRGAKLCIFSHFTFKNLPWCSQSMNPMIYIYILYTDPKLIRETWSHFFVLPPPKNIFCITPWWDFIFDLGFSTNKGRVSTPGKSKNLLENQEKSGQFDIFLEKSGKSKGRKFLPMQIFDF